VQHLSVRGGATWHGGCQLLQLQLGGPLLTVTLLQLCDGAQCCLPLRCCNVPAPLIVRGLSNRRVTSLMLETKTTSVATEWTATHQVFHRRCRQDADITSTQ